MQFAEPRRVAGLQQQDKGNKCFGGLQFSQTERTPAKYIAKYSDNNEIEDISTVSKLKYPKLA